MLNDKFGLYRVQELRKLDERVYNPPWSPEVAGMLRRRKEEARPCPGSQPPPTVSDVESHSSQSRIATSKATSNVSMLPTHSTQKTVSETDTAESVASDSTAAVKSSRSASKRN